MEYLFIYLLQIFDFLDAATFITLLLFIGSLIAFIIAMGMTKFKGENYSDDDVTSYLDTSATEGSNFAKFSKKSLITTLILLCIFSIIPTKQTLLLMGGVYYGKMAAKQVITSEKIKKVNEVIDLQLDKIIKELKK